MAPTDSQLNAARDELIKDRREWFCPECGRPRSKRYCPWNARHPDQMSHGVIARRLIKFDSQVRLFLSNPNGESTQHVFKDG